MKNRFKLTTGFLVISAVMFLTSAVVITRSARQNEEQNLVNVVSEQSGRDARVIASVVTGMVAGAATSHTGIAAPGDAPSNSFDSLTMATFLDNSNIIRLSLLNTDGTVVWTSARGGLQPMDASNSAFTEAVKGVTVTSLQRSAEFTTIDGVQTTGDVTSTYVPLVDATTKAPVQVLEVARDITTTLNARIDSARSSMFQTVFSTLGGSFVVLFGVVLTADLLLGRSRTRAISHERALADEKVVARGLELENQQLRQVNEERDRFLSMVSHELRTPLTTIMGFTEVLRRRQDGERKETNERHLDVMRRNGDHLNSLIEEMLEITRIQAGSFEVIKEGFVLEKLLSQVSDSAKVMLKPRRQQLVVEAAVDGVELHGDRKRVMQVMLNLLSNASKYSPEGSTVKLSVKQVGDSIEIAVGDEGAGIPEDERKLLFERFYRRDDEATRSQSGLGLGLSIVKAIVDAHHGAVNVASEVGAGTVMRVLLPGARNTNVPQTAEDAENLRGELEHLDRLRDLRGIPMGVRAS